MSLFDLKEQNGNIDNKIVAGLERLSRVFRSLLWETAYRCRISPAQLQILLFLRHHAPEFAHASYLAAEFGVSRPTISDAICTIEAKGFIEKRKLGSDARKYVLNLTAAGEALASTAAGYLDNFKSSLAPFDGVEKVQLWQTITTLSGYMNAAGLARTDRSCNSCASFELRENGACCTFIDETLHPADLRIDCPEHAGRYRSGR